MQQISSSNGNMGFKKRQLYMVLCGIFLTNALLAELIGVKIFSGEGVFGLGGAQIPVLGTKLDFNLTAGVIIWPVVFITTDIINEYFGKDGVKRISFLTAALIAYAFLVIVIATALPPAQFWQEINSQGPNGTAFDMDYAFSKVFRQGLGIIVGSLVAFLLGQLLDAHVFHWLKHLTGSRKIWLRATGSTLVSQLVDTVVVLFIAFYLFGDWDLKTVLSVSVINYLYKFTVAVVLTPVLYVAHTFIDRYLAEEHHVPMETFIAKD
ncbi:queuosine precursor transporter [Rufibacter hautae]|uniref:Probable queuosine precursor transporter n=1 Tax=Rufibacter hautae TaxID=2595005 RepID=A0A5B6TCD0_9BACT|nr:queuosine precursor transporter [Rufibacter hautae]KAA3437828.1 queuosine precursor transporter [Rufibacter hautae]